MPIDVPLSVLIINDSPEDAAQIGAELARGGYTPSLEVVATAEGMAHALSHRRWDLVCTEYHLKEFSATSGSFDVKAGASGRTGRHGFRFAR